MEICIFGVRIGSLYVRCLWLEWLIWHKSMIPFTNLRPLDALPFLSFCWRKSQFSKKWKIPSFTKLGTVEKVCNFLLKIIVWVLSEMSRVTVHQIRMEKYLYIRSWDISNIVWCSQLLKFSSLLKALYW